MDLKSRLGYACINKNLQDSSKIFTSRGLIKKSFEKQADTNAQVSKLALANIKDLIKIIQWNQEHDIKFFRMSSNLFPWMSEYELTSLPDWPLIQKNLELVGSLANKWGHRLTFHPGPFNVLASLKPDIVQKTIKELNQHAEIMDFMGLSKTPWAKINIHINTTEGGKEVAAKRFCENFKLLNLSAQMRLTLENDDKASQYSVWDLYELVHKEIGIPIVYDCHHHKFNSSDLTPREAASLANSTWPSGIPAAFHFSSSAKCEDLSIMARAHARGIYEEITDWNTGAWIMVECKDKEVALRHYLKHGILETTYSDFGLPSMSR